MQPRPCAETSSAAAPVPSVRLCIPSPSVVDVFGSLHTPSDPAGHRQGRSQVPSKPSAGGFQASCAILATGRRSRPTCRRARHSTSAGGIVTPLLYRVGGSAARHPWRTFGAWLLAAVLAFGLAATVGGSLSDNYDIPGTDSTRATALLRDKFPKQAGATARVVLHSAAGRVDGAALDAV